MGQIIYQISTGAPDFTASLLPAVLPSQTHISTGVYSFDNVPDGSYILSIIDENGCRYTTPVTITSNQCYMEGTIECVNTTTTTTTLDCTLEGTIQCVEPTTTTTTIAPTTTTTTTVEPTTTTTTTTVDCGTVVEILSIDLTLTTTTTLA